MTEDKKIAAEMVARDAGRLGRDMRDVNPATEFLSFERQSEWPDTDGEGVMMPITIGVRGMLTKREARHCAALWREAVRRYPKAYHAIHLLGFDEDPREIWDIPEAARYVRWFARFAGMDDIKAAERYVLASPDAKLASLNDHSVAESNVGFLAACGVYGDEMKAYTLRNHKPPLVPQ
jgi:hypothetical protein